MENDENSIIPPGLPCSPPMTPLGSCRSYRWTSMTAAHESTRNPSTAEPENMQISQDSMENQPWKGDTWRFSVPRGRTLDLVAAFDQCARHEQAMSSRTRRMSEPAMGRGEKEEMEEQLEIETVFIEDSNDDISTESDEPTTVKIRREPERAPQRPAGDGDLNRVLCDVPYVDIPMNKKTLTPIMNVTPKRPNTLNTRKPIISSLDMNKLADVENYENKENFQDFPQKIGRRGTQAVVFKSSPIQAPPPVPTETKSNVRSMASEFEEKSKNRQFGRRINAQEEIAELKRLMEPPEDYDVADGGQKSVSIAKLRIKTPEVVLKAPKAPKAPEPTEDIIIPPSRGGPSQKTYISSPKHLRQKSLAPEISDIPEERTCDQIDEFFDFGPEKTQDRTIYEGATTEIIESPKPSDQNLQLAHLHFETPQFTRSPTLVTPHAGLPVTEYRVSEKEGPQKVVVHKNSRPPMALATSTPIGTMTRGTHFPHDSFVSSISNFSAFDRSNDTRRQIAKLIDSIDKTRRHIQLAELSLVDAKKSRLVVQELASQRVLLICRERLKLQLDEIRRLQALAVVRHPPPPINRHFKSTMVISNISLQLNKNFHARGSFAFIVLFKCRTEVEASGVVTLLAHYQTRVHVIQFGEHIHFSNLPVDFVIGMEVYMMRVPEYKPPEKTCAAYLAEKVRNLLVPNAHRNRHNRTSVSLSLPAHHHPPQLEFKFCGKLTLDRDSSGDRNFLLDDVTYPLEGTVRLQSTCSSLPEAIDVEYRGFLFQFHEQNISPIMNKGATWHRYWAMLHRGIIFFWKNPLDEKNEQIPISQIDLTKCTNQSIEETQTKTAAQHEFHIELLIDQTPSLLEKRRVVLAAESSDHLVSWLNAINDTLYILRS